MKKWIFVVFLTLSCFSFASIRDNLELLSKEDQERIEKKIQEIYQEKEVKVYINTLVEEEGFQVSDPERTVVLNLHPGKEGAKVSLSFSKDIDIEEEEEQVNLILDNASSLLLSKKTGEYLYQVLDGVEYLLENVEINNPEDLMKKQEEMSEFKKGLLISFAVILLLSSKIGFDFWRKKRKKEEEQGE